MRDYSGPFEGVPAHLRPQLARWLVTTLENSVNPESTANTLALRLHVVRDYRYEAVSQLVNAVVQEEELFLDCVEGALHINPRYSSGEDAAASLQSLLELAGSAYKVGADGKTLVSVTSDETEAIRAAATSREDNASAELTEAWAKAFGRGPDPSDAWDHAIKAVESILRPIVEPKNSKATLGSIIAVLTASPGSWRFVLPGAAADHSVENFTSTLRLVWPNPDRHGGGGRQPTLAEARAVVILAASIVQWHREGAVLARR